MMKKSSLLSKTLLSGLLLTSIFGSTVHAQDTATSDATIEFVAPQDAPDIYQPDGQGGVNEEPQNPDDVTGNTGPLTIDYASSLDFGSHDIEVAAQTYTLQTPETPYVQVSDRRGTQEGWELNVQASNFTLDGVNTLDGAALSFGQGDVRSNLDQPLEAEPTTYPVQTLVTGGDAQTVTSADAGEGIGTWLTVWDNNEVELFIPQGAASPGTHTSTLTWTLTDAPGAN